jgi:hypothetical protein
MGESAFTVQIEQTTKSKWTLGPLLDGVRKRLEASAVAGSRISSEVATTVVGVKNEHFSVTPEVSCSSPVAPVSQSESNCARRRAFAPDVCETRTVHRTGPGAAAGHHVERPLPTI